MHPANIIRPRPTTADKGKQAERREEEPAKASADEESPAEQVNEVSSAAERPINPVAGQPGQSQKDAPLADQGLARNVPEVSQFDHIYFLVTNVRHIVRQVYPFQPCLVMLRPGSACKPSVWLGFSQPRLGKSEA